MFHKIVDLLKEVFWIKPSRKKAKPTRRKTVSVKKKSTSAVKKIPLKKKPKKLPVPKKKMAKPLKETAKPLDPALQQVGIITHYFDRIKVCVVQLTQGTVLIGDKLTIQGIKTKFVQKVWSMQIESEDVKVAKKGQNIGLKVDKLVVVGDKVYK